MGKGVKRFYKVEEDDTHILFFINCFGEMKCNDKLVQYFGKNMDVLIPVV